MNILVTGANGQLGNEMRIVAKDRKADKYIFTDVNQIEGVETTFLDITDLEAIRKIVRDNHVDVIVNCAAYTNVDAAESNEALAEKLNADAPENLAKAMKEAGGLLVQISTDYVFEHVISGYLNKQSSCLFHCFCEVLRRIGIQFLRQCFVALRSVHVGICGAVHYDIHMIIPHNLADSLQICDVKEGCFHAFYLVDISENIFISLAILCDNAHLVPELAICSCYKYVHVILFGLR